MVNCFIVKPKCPLFHTRYIVNHYVKVLHHRFNILWPFSQKFLQFLERFSVKNFVREILRAFHKRIRSLFNLKNSLTRNFSLATVSNGLIFRWKLSQLKMNRGFRSQKAYYRPQFINIEWNQCECLKTDVTITTCVQK